jgi:hypothetical protein
MAQPKPRDVPPKLFTPKPNARPVSVEEACKDVSKRFPKILDRLGR